MKQTLQYNQSKGIKYILGSAILYRTRRNFRGVLIFVFFVPSLNPRI